MIVGIGNDIVLINRVVKAIENKRFLEKCFTEKEIELISKNSRVSASNFSVKESFVKALGTGFTNVDIKDIEVLRNELGKPYINVLGKLKAHVDDNLNILVTISHSDEYVVSTVVIERC